MHKNCAIILWFHLCKRNEHFCADKNIVFLSEWATYFPFIETILVNYFSLLLFLESFENINKAYPSNTAVMVQSPTFSNIVKDLPGRPLETSRCLWFKNHLSHQCQRVIWVMALLWTRKTWQKVEALFDPPLENWMVVFNQSSKKSNSTEKRNFSFWLRERKKTWWTPNLVWRHNINFVSMEWYSQSIVHPLKRESVCSLFCRSQGKCNLSKILVFKPMRRTKVSKVHKNYRASLWVHQITIKAI